MATGYANGAFQLWDANQKYGGVNSRLVGFDAWKGPIFEYSYTSDAEKAGSKADEYQKRADAAAAGIVSSAQAGVSAAKSAGKTTQEQIRKAEEAATGIDVAVDQMYGQAGLLNEHAKGIGDQAELVNRDADRLDAASKEIGRLGDAALAENEALRHYVSQLTDYAGQLWNEGTGIFGTGEGLVGLGNGLMNLDESQGGIIGEYVRSIKAADPRRYVAQAAADVQGSFDNAKGQLSRELSRAGISGSSGAALAQKRLLAQTYAATLAGAKTRAWQTGADEQRSVLRAALDDAMGVIRQGTDIQAQGAGVQAQGVSALGKAAETQGVIVNNVGTAAGIKKSAADVQAQAAGVRTNAGSLRAQAADVVAKAGTLYGSIGGLAAQKAQIYSGNASANNQYVNALTNAYGNLSSAYGTYAEYLASQASGFAEYATSNGAQTKIR